MINKSRRSYIFVKISMSGAVLVSLTPKGRDSEIQASGNPLAVKIGLDTLGANYPGRRFSFDFNFLLEMKYGDLLRVSSLHTNISHITHKCI